MFMIDEKRMAAGALLQRSLFGRSHRFCQFHWEVQQTRQSATVRN